MPWREPEKAWTQDVELTRLAQVVDLQTSPASIDGVLVGGPTNQLPKILAPVTSFNAPKCLLQSTYPQCSKDFHHVVSTLFMAGSATVTGLPCSHVE